MEALNRPAPRCITDDGPRVIGWGTWAAAIQRHLCHRVAANDVYVRSILGQPRDGVAQIAVFDRQWGGLDLYPFVHAVRWKHGDLELETFRQGLIDGVKTSARRPELVPAGLWKHMTDVAEVAVTRRRMPDSAAWFANPVPAGTAYDAGRRALAFRTGAPVLLATLGERDPWSFTLARRTLVARHPVRAPMEEVQAAFARRQGYDMRPLNWVMEVADPSSSGYDDALEAACALRADRCSDLAQHYVAQNRDDEAAQTFQRAFAANRDTVVVANQARFLVRYHHDKGQDAEAMRLAELSAETGASKGLGAMGLLLEWRGRPQEAELYFQRIVQQYDNRMPLLGFYYRARAADASYAPKFAALASRIFPSGPEKLDTATLPVTPTDGVRVSEPSALARSAGLDTGDVIVALDGWRVHNVPQYEAIRELDWRPEFVLHRWRRGRYESLPARAADRLLNFSMANYPLTGAP